MRYTLKARLSKKDLLRHFLLLGATGSGKTTLASNILYDVVRTSNKTGEACILLEPHGDFSVRAGLMRIVDKKRLVFLSTAIDRLADIQNSENDKHIFTFNPFENDGSEAMRERLRHELTSVITELLASSEHSTQYGITVNMATMLSNAIAVTLASSEPTIITLKRLMTSDNEDLLEIGRNFPHPEVSHYFRHVFETEGAKQTRNSILNKLSYFLSDVQLYRILSAKSGTLQLDRFISEGRFIVIHTPIGLSAFTQSFVGRLIVARVLAHTLAKEAIPEDKRVATYMFIDEFQSYITGSLPVILQVARKFKLGLVLSVQSLRQIQDRHIVNTIQTNTLWKATGVIDGASRAEIVREFSTSADVVANLLPMQFLIKRMGHSEPFKFTTQPLPKSLFYTEREAIALYRYLIRESGLYVRIADLPQPAVRPPAPPTSAKKERGKEKKTKSKKDDANDNPFDGLEPAF